MTFKGEGKKEREEKRGGRRERGVQRGRRTDPNLDADAEMALGDAIQPIARGRETAREEKWKLRREMKCLVFD